jgi:DNA ligase-1
MVDQDLVNLAKLVDELRTTNSSNGKKAILPKHESCKELISLIMNPLIPFNLKSATVKKMMKQKKFQTSMKECEIKEYAKIKNLLSDLSTREISGHDGIRSTIQFIENCGEKYTNLIFEALDKKLKVGMGASTINKIWPNTIPEFSVALADKYDESMHKKVFEASDNFYISRKLDGVRCLGFVKLIKPGKINATFYSRQGNLYETLSKVESEFQQRFSEYGALYEKLGTKCLVFDGEICKMGNDGSEDFKEIMKEVRKKNFTVKNPKYLLFDCLTEQEFLSKTSEVSFIDRIFRMKKMMTEQTKKNIIEIVDQIECNPKTFAELSQKSVDCGWEGLMLRKDTNYKGKRSKDILKVKQFQTEEYRVIEIETGPYQVVNKKTGLEETIDTMTNVIIEHEPLKDGKYRECVGKKRVSVGSGFSVDERKEFYKNPSKIVGKLISVQFFEETQRSDGSVSLRFPTFKGLYGKNRDC